MLSTVSLHSVLDLLKTCVVDGAGLSGTYKDRIVRFEKLSIRENLKAPSSLNPENRKLEECLNLKQYEKMV